MCLCIAKYRKILIIHPLKVVRMEYKKNKDFVKHKNWCGRCANHAFALCPFNKDAQKKKYFQAPCCGRNVVTLENKHQCVRCSRISVRKRKEDMLNYFLDELEEKQISYKEYVAGCDQKATVNRQIIQDSQMIFNLDAIRKELVKACDKVSVLKRVDKIPQCKHPRVRDLARSGLVSSLKGDRYEAQMFGMSHTMRFDETQIDTLLAKITTSSHTMISEAKQSLLELMHGLEDAAIDVIIKMTITLALVWRIKDDKIAVLLALAQLLYSLGINKAQISAFQDFVQSWIEHMPFVGQTVTYEDMFHVVAMFISLVTLRSIPESKRILEFFRNTCAARNFSFVASSIVRTVTELIQLAISFIRGQILGHSDVWLDKEPYDCIINWSADVNKLNQARHLVSEWSEDMLLELDSLHDRMIQIANFWRMNKPPTSVMAMYTTNSGVVRKLLDEVSALGVRQVPRVEPDFIMLQGRSAYGKSLITPILASDLIRECLPPKENRVWSSYVYNRNPETDFWDGYAGQKVIVYDDFGQLFDTLGVPNKELMEVIRLGNSAPFFPNMARLEQKGRTRIACDFIILTANQAPNVAGIQSLKEPEAVLRRIEQMIAVDVLPEFKNQDGTMDKEKVLQWHRDKKCGCSVESFVDICLGPYRFDIKTWKNNQWTIIQSALTYPTLLEVLVTKHKEKMERSRLRLAYINDRLNKKNSEEFYDVVDGAQAPVAEGQGGGGDDIWTFTYDDMVNRAAEIVIRTHKYSNGYDHFRVARFFEVVYRDGRLGINEQDPDVALAHFKKRVFDRVSELEPEEYIPQSGFNGGEDEDDDLTNPSIAAEVCAQRLWLHHYTKDEREIIMSYYNNLSLGTVSFEQFSRRVYIELAKINKWQHEAQSGGDYRREARDVVDWLIDVDVAADSAARNIWLYKYKEREAGETVIYYYNESNALIPIMEFVKEVRKRLEYYYGYQAQAGDTNPDYDPLGSLMDVDIAIDQCATSIRLYEHTAYEKDQTILWYYNNCGTIETFQEFAEKVNDRVLAMMPHQAQVGGVEALVQDVRKGDKKAQDILRDWACGLPSTSFVDKNDLLLNVVDGVWDAEFLKAAAYENGKP